MYGQKILNCWHRLGTKVGFLDKPWVPGGADFWSHWLMRVSGPVGEWCSFFCGWKMMCQTKTQGEGWDFEKHIRIQFLQNEVFVSIMFCCDTLLGNLSHGPLLASSISISWAVTVLEVLCCIGVRDYKEKNHSIQSECDCKIAWWWHACVHLVVATAMFHCHRNHHLTCWLHKLCPKVLEHSKTTRIIQPKIHEKPSSSLGTSLTWPDHQAQEGDIGDFSALLEALQGAEAWVLRWEKS